MVVTTVSQVDLGHARLFIDEYKHILGKGGTMKKKANAGTILRETDYPITINHTPSKTKQNKTNRKRKREAKQIASNLMVERNQ